MEDEMSTAFDGNGNITSKSDFGTYSYPQNDLMEVTNFVENYSADQSMDYTSFEKVSWIVENPYRADFVYDSDQQRALMTVKNNGNDFLKRIYAGSSYMKETLSGVTKEYTFIGGDAYSAPAVIEKYNGNNTPYFLLRDHLGSITHVVNNSGTQIYEYSFDDMGKTTGFKPLPIYRAGSLSTE